MSRSGDETPALVLRSRPQSAFTRVFDALWGGVSKDGHIASKTRVNAL